MAAVGEVLFVIKGDTTKLSHALERANKKMRNFSKSAARVGRAAGIAAAAATAAMTAMTAKTMQAIDAQSKLASSLNTTSASLAVLERAASLSGVENLNGMLNIFNRQIGEAASGLGPAADALERLGLTASQLSAMPLDERVKLIGDKINQFIPVAEQAAVASDLFGRSGAAMLNVFRDGGVIDEAKRQVEGFGLAISDVDAAKIEIANDAFSSMKEIVRGFLTQVAIKVAPVVYGISSALQEAAIAAGGMGEVVGNVFDGIIKGAGFVGDSIRIRIVLKTLHLVFQGVYTVAIATFSGIVRAVDTAINAIQDKINKFTAGARWAFEKVGIDIQPFETTQSRFSQVLDQMASDAAAKTAEIAGSLGDMWTAPTASGQMGGFMENAQAKTQEMAEAIAAQRAALREVAAEQNEMDAAQDAENEARKTGSAQAGADARVKIAEMEAAAKKFSLESASGEILSALGAFGDKALKVSKVMGAAQALVSTYQGAAEALKLPFPQNLAAAATVTAKGLGLVSAIKGVSKGGGGGSVAAGGGATAAPAPSGPETYITLQGDNFTGQSVIELINKATENGGRIAGVQYV